MKKSIKIFSIILMIMMMILVSLNCSVKATPVHINENNQNNPNNQTPVQMHGRLKLNGTKIVDKNGKEFQIRGISTHGIAWFPDYVNQEAFYYMRDEWKINAVRLAMYSDPNAGYNKSMHEKVKQGVEYAKNAGLYVIIDWHILSDGNPNIYKSSAIEFFKEMTNLYKDYENVIYEICNEPNGDVQWERDVKPYAEEVIKEIRNIDKNAIIVVGTPTWSQDVDVVSQSPITGYENIMYSLHFYAATHKDSLRQKAQTALNAGLPIFVTEFGICDASGNGNIDEQEADTWIKFLDDNNISWMCWNLSNKNESSAILTNTNKLTGWTEEELSQSGKWLVKTLKKYNVETVTVEDNTTNQANKQKENTVVENNVESNTNTVNEEKGDKILQLTIVPAIICFVSLFLVFLLKSKLDK